MTTTWDVFRYPLISTRKDAEYYDEVTCERDVAQALVKALHDAYGGEWWFYIKEKSIETTEPATRNWDDTGQYVTSLKEEPREPVGDDMYDSLKKIVHCTPRRR